MTFSITIFNYISNIVIVFSLKSNVWIAFGIILLNIIFKLNILSMFYMKYVFIKFKNKHFNMILYKFFQSNSI